MDRMQAIDLRSTEPGRLEIVDVRSVPIRSVGSAPQVSKSVVLGIAYYGDICNVRRALHLSVTGAIITKRTPLAQQDEGCG